MFSDLDVFTKSGGCYMAHLEHGIYEANSKGEFILTFTSSVQNPMVSLISIEPVDEVAEGLPDYEHVMNILLVDASNRAVISAFGNGTTIDTAVDGKELSIVVEASDEVEQIRFRWNGNVQNENRRPYAMDGKKGQDAFNPVKYLTTSGDKIVRIDVFGSNRTLLESIELLFRVEGEETTDFSAQSEAPTAILIDAGAVSEDLSLLSPNTTRGWTFEPSIQNVPDFLDPSFFQSHRAASAFTYTLPGFEPSQPVSVTLGFAENYEPNCVLGKRRFDVEVNGQELAYDLDVFGTTGCFSALLLTKPYQADPSGNVVIDFFSKKRDPMVSVILVDAIVETPSTTQIPTSSSIFPTVTPSSSPLAVLPSDYPSQIPSDEPSNVPSDLPSSQPSQRPTTVPILSDIPSKSPFLISLNSLIPAKENIAILGYDLMRATDKVQLLSLPDGGSYDLADSGYSLTLLVDTTDEVGFLRFTWANQSRTEGRRPFLLGGKNTSAAYWPVPFLAEPGFKTVHVQAYRNDSSPLQNTSISFTVFESVTDDVNTDSLTDNAVFEDSESSNILIDAGSESEDLTLISGTIWVSVFDQNITGVPLEYDESVFRSHRSGYSFNYTVGGFPPFGQAEITLGFAENYEPNCFPTKRMFNVSVNGEVFETDLDVFGEVGCFAAYTNTKMYDADRLGRFTIEFTPVKQNPMVSLIDIQEVKDDSTTTSDRGANTSDFSTVRIENITLVSVANEATLMSLTFGGTYNTEETGDSLTLLVEASPEIVRTRFRWNGLSRSEGRPPFVMGGKDGSSGFTAVPYLASPGGKTVLIDVFDADNIKVETQEITFTVVGIEQDIFTEAGFANLFDDIVINAGGPDEDESLVTGTTWSSFFTPNITNVPDGLDGEIFKYHRSGNDFSYTIEGFEPGSESDISLGFAENYAPNCHSGKRVFSIQVNGEVFIENLDVYGTVGCFSAYVETQRLQANSAGAYVIELLPVKRNPILSVIAIDAIDDDDDAATSKPTPSSPVEPKKPVARPVVTAPTMPTGKSGGGYITSLDLVNATDRSLLTNIFSGDVIDTSLAGTSLSIVVQTLDAVDVVKFKWSEGMKSEGSPPYAMLGKNTSKAYNAVPYLASPGSSKEVIIEAFGVGGNKLETVMIVFSVV